MQAKQWDFNFTAIPNFFLDSVANTLSPTELRIMLYIYRHTLGYQKLTDTISYNQFIKGIVNAKGERLDNGAGVSRAALSSALLKLEERDLIKREQTNSAIAYRVVLPTNLKENKTSEQKPQAVQLLDSAETKSSSNHELTKETSQNKKNKTGRAVSFNSEKPEKQQLDIIKIPASKKVQKGVNLLKTSIPGLTSQQAENMVATAFANGRDLLYLQQLVSYVTTNPAIKTPAAVLITLVKSNAVRIPSNVAPDNKFTPLAAKNRTSSKALPSAAPKLDLAKLAARLEKSTLLDPATESQELATAAKPPAVMPELETALRFSLQCFNSQAAKYLRGISVTSANTLEVRFWGLYEPDLAAWLPEVQLYYPNVEKLIIRN